MTGLRAFLSFLVGDRGWEQGERGELGSPEARDCSKESMDAPCRRWGASCSLKEAGPSGSCSSRRPARAGEPSARPSSRPSSPPCRRYPTRRGEGRAASLRRREGMGQPESGESSRRGGEGGRTARLGLLGLGPPLVELEEARLDVCVAVARRRLALAPFAGGRRVEVLRLAGRLLGNDALDVGLLALELLDELEAVGEVLQDGNERVSSSGADLDEASGEGDGPRWAPRSSRSRCSPST